VRFIETVMGIPMSIDIRDAGDHADAAQSAFDILREADARFSVYRMDSEVSEVNRGERPPSSFSDDLREVIAIGEEARRASGGAFRIRTPDGRFDLDGVVKGWAVARAVDALRDRAVQRFCVNAGGDVAVGAGPSEGEAWNVGVRSPGDPAAMLAVLSVTDSAVATSGAYERGAHITDGRTGAEAHGLASATVVAADLTTADVLATSVFALGTDGVKWAVANGARGVLAVSDAGDLLIEGDPGFARPILRQ